MEPPPILTVPVDVPVFMLVGKLELLLIFTAPPDVVNAPDVIVNESPEASLSALAADLYNSTSDPNPIPHDAVV